jgi:pimeloyl-ACP methyl ester carboxylesterase
VPLATERLRLHGHDVEYTIAGSGPALLLVHGITSSLRTWSKVVPLLAENHTVIAPDLLGHGGSAKPRGDYSLGSFASGLRDVLIALGHKRATVVGHSMGGGIAMQLAYQFPERVERLVLVNSGGLGREVSLLLRAATLPGAELVLPLLFGQPLFRPVGFVVGRAMGALGLRSSGDLEGMAHGVASLRRAEARRAFIHTARSIMDAGGQRVNATDRLYLAASMPSLIVWGERDPLIPADHGRAAHAAMPGSRLEVFADAGHFPFNDDPGRFAALLEDFIATTEPAVYDEERVRTLMLENV